MSLSLHPLILDLPENDFFSSGSQDPQIFFPLNTISGGTFVPLVGTAERTVAFSLPGPEIVLVNGLPLWTFLDRVTLMFRPYSILAMASPPTSDPQMYS